MPCNQADFARGTSPRVSDTDLTDAGSLSSRYLVVSDAPETIDPPTWEDYPYSVG